MNMAFVKAGSSPNGKQNINHLVFNFEPQKYDTGFSCSNEHFEKWFSQMIFDILRKSPKIMYVHSTVVKIITIYIMK